MVCFSEFICDVVYSGFMRWIFFSAMDSSIFVSNNNTLYSLRLYNLNSSFVEPSLYTRLVDGTTNRMIAIGTYSEIYDILVTVSFYYDIWKEKSLKIPKGQSESVYRRRIDNTMAIRKSTKGQTN